VSVTYILRDINSDLTSQAVDHNKQALVATAGSAGLSLTLGGGASGSYAWYTEPGVPNLTEWPAGDYTLGFNVSTAGADITYTLSLRRVDSAGVLQQTLGTSGSQSGTGAKSFTQNIGSPISVAAGDRLVGVVSATRAASHGNQTLTIDVNVAGAELVGAWEPPVPTGPFAGTRPLLGVGR
jgi:hypothetical protein